MLLDASLYWTFAVAVFFLILKPGPCVFTYSSLALEGRIIPLLSFWSGYAVAAWILYVFFLLTLSSLPAGFGIIFLFLKGIAAVLFVILGMNGLRSSFEDDQVEAEALKSKFKYKNNVHNFFMGGTLMLSNPYDYVFVLTVIPSIFGTTSFSMPDIIMINIIVMVIDFGVNALYVVPILYFRGKVFSAQRLEQLKILTSVMLILIGFYIFSTLFLSDALVETNLLSS